MRGWRLAIVVLVMVIIGVTQGGITYSMSSGPLHDLLPAEAPYVAGGFFALRVVLLLTLGVLWFANRRRPLFAAIVAANTFFTLALLVDTVSLIGVLAGLSSRAGQALVIDVVLMAISNILIFSIWYWIIDPPGVGVRALDDSAWAFLFPQRQGPLPHYAGWLPQYPDCLFVAFTTSFAFSPTDAMPLTRTAKMLMLTQSTISIVILTGIAGTAINVLAGSGA